MQVFLFCNLLLQTLTFSYSLCLHTINNTIVKHIKYGLYYFSVPHIAYKVVFFQKKNCKCILVHFKHVFLSVHTEVPMQSCSYKKERKSDAQVGIRK